MSSMPHDKIAVVDFGGQYAHLIATKIRRLHVLAEIRQPEDPTEQFADYKGIVLSGSPSLSAFGEDSAYNQGIYDLAVPILGFCFGHQEIAKHYGGEVIHGGREWGAADLHVIREHPLFAGLGRQAPVEDIQSLHGALRATRGAAVSRGAGSVKVAWRRSSAISRRVVLVVWIVKARVHVTPLLDRAAWTPYLASGGPP